jgi:multiple sugar transport system permease protein
MSRDDAWTARRVLHHVVVYAVIGIYVLPLVWMLCNSLNTTKQSRRPSPRLLPQSFQWRNFTEAWTTGHFGTFIRNGLVVSTISTLITVVVSILAGYAFARLRFRGRDALFFVFLMTLMIPQDLLVVPLYIEMSTLGWVNTFQALILPWAFTAFGTFLLRQFFMSIPTELEQAASIDGARRLATLRYVMVPIARPAIATVAIFQFIAMWNLYIWPLVILQGQDKATVPLGLSFFIDQGGAEWNIIMAAATISIVPTTLLVVALSRYLVRGITTAGFGGR